MKTSVIYPHFSTFRSRDIGSTISYQKVPTAMNFIDMFWHKFPRGSLLVLCLVVQSCPTLQDPMDYSPPGSSVHGDSPGKNIGVGCHAILQGIFSTQGLNPGLQHLYQLSHKGSPRILEWVAFPFSRGSSQPRNQTRVSCIAGRFFTSWATREVLDCLFEENQFILL